MQFLFYIEKCYYLLVLVNDNNTDFYFMLAIALTNLCVLVNIIWIRNVQ